MQEDKPASSCIATTSAESAELWPTSKRNAYLARRLAVLSELFPATAPRTTAGVQAHLEEWALIFDATGDKEFERVISDHIRSGKFFPTVAELRRLAGMHEVDQAAVEGEAAWQSMLKWMRFWHPNVRRQEGAPELTPRTEYALRAIGGPYAVFMREIGSTPFLKRHFLEAYRLAPIAEAHGCVTKSEAAKVLKNIGTVSLLRKRNNRNE